jgi:putative glutamine amidotransferase
MKPTIGILMDWQAKGSFSARPYYAIRDSYFQAVWDAGGLPIGLPLLETSGTEYLQHVDGIVVPGGDYPSPSRWYGDGHGIPDEHPRTIVNEQMIRDMLLLDKPFLAVCAGIQEMAAATGGLLYWDVVKAREGSMDHRKHPAEEFGHDVEVVAGTLLEKLVGAGPIQVNSRHNEAIRLLGDGVLVSGVAPDGVIEAIEIPGKRFALGVQWHPEFGLSEADHALFVGLVEACK